MKDSQFATGFRGQLCFVVSAIKVMSVGEPKKFKRLIFFQWIYKEVDRWVRLPILPEQLDENRRFSRIDGQVPFIKPVYNQMCSKYI